MAIHFEIHRTGSDFSCTADGSAPFYVGRRVPYDGNIGLYNIFAGTPIAKLNYSSNDFTASHGFWAHFIEPTAKCEGRNFLTLNTYDRAAFTFGFAQFAAHVAEGDFVLYFRAMLRLPEAASYFPHLAIVNGHICETDVPGPPQQLESETSTQALMNYLNPTLQEVEDNEVLAAAKLIHWTTNVVAARNAQVEQMVETFTGFMKRADANAGIDGRPADQCCVIADILHHGRAGRKPFALINPALKSATPFDSLIAIGAPKWDERKKTLKAAIQADPNFAGKSWSRAKNDFV